MLRFLVSRLTSALVAALLSSLVVFVLMRAVPGDIVAQMLGQSSDPTAAAALRGFFGLDRPILGQFADWLGQLAQGDLGRSWYQGKRVTLLIAEAFEVTLEVAVATLALATLIGVPLGVVAGIFEGTRLDAAIQTFNLVGLSAPVFWIGLMLLVGASSLLSWSPPFAYMPPSVDLADNLSIIVLPVLSLALLQAAAYSHFVRDCMVGELRRDYVRAAIAKGLSPAQVYFKHALRNILIPLVTFMGLILVQILGGTVVIESLFSLPGLGRLILSGIQGRDYPVVQGTLLFVVVIAITINFVVDLLYGLIDPRLRP
ncbi:MAG: ABC transporter permease [Alphaproteobacteria bacterium]|nr:ABC transporter permease [Alphaproteobacteria bacterium]